MELKSTIDDKNSLRSKKVKQIGPIPQSLVRWGTVIIVIITFALIAAICLLPYPYSNGEIILHHLIRLMN